MAIIGTIIGGISSFFGGLFGFKKEQGEVLGKAIDVIKEANISEAARVQAIAAVITAESKSGYWLSAVWRPMLMVVFAGLLISYWFGYAPPNINEPLSPMLEQLFDLLKLGIGGYIGGRTLEKIVDSLSLGRILKQFIEKKVL